MIYELWHKNINVLTVEYEAETNKFGKVLSIYNEEHIPVGIQNISNYNLSQGLQFWWQSRLIPKNRSNFKINNPDIDFLLTGSNGFNLSDQYWIKEEKSDMTWEKGNFYTNPFNEDIGEYITGHGNYKLQNMTSHSPDLFSNGQQDKRWVIEKGTRFLVKYGRPPYYEQPFNEMLASEICRRLNIPHVQYTLLVKGKSEPVIYSMCPCFVNSDTEFVPAGFIQYASEKSKQVSNYNHLLECCKKSNIKNKSEIEKSFMQMNILDYITANTDRHYGNFGFLRNAETLEWIGNAPNFDTGNAMFYEYPTSDLRRSTSLMENVISRSFSTNQREQAEKFSDRIALLDVDFKKLDGIKDYYEDLLSRNPKEDAERIHLLSNLLVKRIENFKEIIYFKNSVSNEFIHILSSDTSDLRVIDKINVARKQIYKTDKNKGILLDKYLQNIKTKSIEEFELKFQKEINKVVDKQKKHEKDNKSISDDDGTSISD